MSLELLIENYGLIAIFLGTAIEGETAAFLGGVAAHRHLLSYLTASLAASAGSFAGDQMFFFLGRYLRRLSFVQRIIEKPAVARVNGLLERHPIGFIFAFRFLPGLRTISPVVIGTTTVPTTTFLLLNVAAAMVWGQLFTSVGYIFGHGVEQLLGHLSLHLHLIIAMAAALLLVFAGSVVRRRGSV
ncbi:DedA family protein [Rhizobium sp. Root1220]|uniref:DedA family protein n=1 Tax=Rhizobium sp. Root1220 TaxID=1736432 RepID=UPI0006F27AFF|nr:DedA family protein [Rhizobium sp. Root1220]KQV81819.1 hypothetical protein ASC90_04010 [Rhizobium sp. Root1220]